MSRPLLVLYGSQTGTAQEVAERIGGQGGRLHFDIKVTSMDSFPLTQLPNSPLVVYVASTIGQGEEPDNMKKTWKLLRKNLPANFLAGQRFGVLGLGDSSYPKFNHVAKKLSRRLLQLGGVQLLQHGLGDDQHDLGPDFVIDSWLDQFWGLALQVFHLPKGLSPIGKEVLPPYPPKYKMTWVEDKDEVIKKKVEKERTRTAFDWLISGTNTDPACSPLLSIQAREEESVIEYSQSCPFLSPVLSCARQTPEDHFQDVRLVRLDISNSGMKYKPGDVALVQPSNLAHNIEQFFTLFPGLDPDKEFYLTPSSPNTPLPPTSIIPQPCSIRHAVTHYFDIQSIPKRYFFELLSHFTTDELEKEKFIEFNTAEGQQDLYDYCNRPRRHILEVLYDFRHTTPNIPFEYLWDLIPQIKPRSFSIASSQSYHGSVLELLVAVVRYRSSLKTPRQGLCSNWLAGVNQGDKIPVWIRPGAFKFPPEARPVVMVGPGTGVASFRSFAAEETSNNRQKLLFFGCRNKAADFFFNAEWKSHKNLEVVSAFSRDQEDKEYVQHKMDQNQEMICRYIIDDGGWFFIAGNSKNMPTQVRESLISALATRLGNNRALQWVETMEAQGKYQTETWA